MKAFIIYLPTREHSVTHSKYMLDTLSSYGIDTELFEGTLGSDAIKMANKANKTLYPYSIKNRELNDDEIKDLIRPELYQKFKEKHIYKVIERQLIGENDKGKLSRPGVVGCFYSHYRLWQKCIELNEPIMIFEDDVKFYRNFEPVEFQDLLILSLGKNSFFNEPYKTYLESPSGAPMAKHWKNFSMPGASGYAIKPHTAKGLVKFYKSYWYPADNAINQFMCKMEIHSHIMGRNTLPEEGNISMTKSKDWITENNDSSDSTS
jgi:GR25 family glycosyltransferase involved in LPS biosynthesis